MAEVDGNDGAVDLVPREPLHEAVVEGSMGVEEEHAASALAPGEDVLADEVFEKLGLAGAGAAADVKVLIALGARESEAPVGAGQDAEVEVVAGRRTHRQPV